MTWMAESIISDMAFPTLLTSTLSLVWSSSSTWSGLGSKSFNIHPSKHLFIILTLIWHPSLKSHNIGHLDFVTTLTVSLCSGTSSCTTFQLASLWSPHGFFSSSPQHLILQGFYQKFLPFLLFFPWFFSIAYPARFFPNLSPAFDLKFQHFSPPLHFLSTIYAAHHHSSTVFWCVIVTNYIIIMHINCIYHRTYILVTLYLCCSSIVFFSPLLVIFDHFWSTYKLYFYSSPTVFLMHIDCIYHRTALLVTVFLLLINIFSGVVNDTPNTNDGRKNPLIAIKKISFYTHV